MVEESRGEYYSRLMEGVMSIKMPGVGVFTIVEVREGKGSDAGWGRLKSGAGWISLDYCQRV